MSNVLARIKLLIDQEGGEDDRNKLKICTRLEPTTTKRKNAIRVLLTGDSSSCSAAFPTGTLPRFVIFLSNLVLRFRMLRGRVCRDTSGHSSISKA